jgi:hypothetical protein
MPTIWNQLKPNSPATAGQCPNRASPTEPVRPINTRTIRAAATQGESPAHRLPRAIEAKGSAIHTPVQNTSVIRLCIGSVGPRNPTRTSPKNASSDR